MRDLRQSELYDQTFRLMGLTFGPHPDDKRLKMIVTVYAVEPEQSRFVVCTKPIQARRVNDFRRRLNPTLGTVVPDDLTDAMVIDQAIKYIDADSYDQARLTIESGWPGISWRWHGSDD